MEALAAVADCGCGGGGGWRTVKVAMGGGSGGSNVGKVVGKNELRFLTKQLRKTKHASRGSVSRRRKGAKQKRRFR